MAGKVSTRGKEAVSSRHTDRRLIESKFNEHYADLRKFVCYRIKNRHDAEDIVQEAFLRLAKTIGSGGRISNIKSWIRKVTTHLMIDHCRKRQRAFKRLDGNISDDEMPISSDLLIVFHARYSEPDIALRLKEFRKIFQQSLLQFPPTIRAVLLAYFFGLNIRQISEVLGVEQSWVNNTWTRNRMKLWNYIKKKIPEIGEGACKGSMRSV